MVQPASKILDIGSLTQRIPQRHCFADTTTSLEGLDEIPDEFELTLEPVEAPLLRSQHESSVPTANDARKPGLLGKCFHLNINRIPHPHNFFIQLKLGIQSRRQARTYIAKAGRMASVVRLRSIYTTINWVINVFISLRQELCYCLFLD